MTKSSFDRIMKNSARKKSFALGYREFLLNELVHALMQNDEKSIRQIAKDTGVSPRIIQDIKSGKQKDIKLSNFFNLIKTFGYHVALTKGKQLLDLSRFQMA